MIDLFKLAFIIIFNEGSIAEMNDLRKGCFR